MYAYCAEHGVPHRRIGKLIVARNAEEVRHLGSHIESGVAAGVDCVDDAWWLNAAGLLALQPIQNTGLEYWIVQDPPTPKFSKVEKSLRRLQLRTNRTSPLEPPSKLGRKPKTRMQILRKCGIVN